LGQNSGPILAILFWQCLSHYDVRDIAVCNTIFPFSNISLHFEDICNKVAKIAKLKSKFFSSTILGE